jgi:hypothetical protein
MLLANPLGTWPLGSEKCYGALEADASERKWRMRSCPSEGWLDRYPPFAKAARLPSSLSTRAVASNPGDIPLCTQQRRRIVVSLPFKVLRIPRLQHCCRCSREHSG